MLEQGHKKQRNIWGNCQNINAVWNRQETGNNVIPNTKILNYEYRVLQKKNVNLQRKMRFYEEVDGLLRQPFLRTAKWKQGYHATLELDFLKWKCYRLSSLHLT